MSKPFRERMWSRVSCVYVNTHFCRHVERIIQEVGHVCWLSIIVSVDAHIYITFCALLLQEAIDYLNPTSVFEWCVEHLYS